jgi:Zn-dependent dipeptidase, microsomal dipeptidase homolog
MSSFLVIFTIVSYVAAFSVFGQTMPKDADPALWARALKLHKSAIIVDGHNDIPSPMTDDDYDLATPSVGKIHLTDGTPYHTDLQRFRASGITGEFFSIYVGGDTWKAGRAMPRAIDMIDATYRQAEKYPQQLTMCTTAADIRNAKKAGKVCVLMGIEGGYAIENSLSALREFYRLGVRYMTLTHNVTHDWADAHHDEPKNNGLSDFGKEVVREMNRLGMLVDISHVSTKVMNDVLDVSTAPIIASHSGARALNDHTRNVPDDVLKRVAKNGGVIMVNFYPDFLDARTNKEDNEMTAKLKPQADALREKYKNDPAGLNAAMTKLAADNPYYICDYTRIVDHIDHIKQVAGIDHVGIGSDFDGVPYLPKGMNGMEDLALVTYEMLKRGYSDADVRKVLGENFLRAFAQAEKVAGNRQISGQGSLKRIK